jgi:cytochrome c oxidase assembly factor CtaG
VGHPYAFEFEPVYLALCVVTALLYWRQRPDRRHAVLFGVGLALIAVALNSPLERLARGYLLLIHLLQNVMIADWAPPLLILGLTPALRTAIARQGGRIFATLTRPKVALPVWLVVWYAVHLGAFYDWALRNPWALNIEHGLLIAAGFVFWWPVLAREQRALSTPLSIAYLGSAFVTSAFLGLALMFSTSPFYDYYRHVPRLWGLSPARDQNLGGLLMNVEQTIVFFVAIAWFLLQLLEEEDQSPDGGRTSGDY